MEALEGMFNYFILFNWILGSQYPYKRISKKKKKRAKEKKN